MIALSRADARRFRAVARRAFPNGRPKGPSPPVKVTAAGERLTLACHVGAVVVTLRATTPKSGKGTVVIPLSAFDAFEAATGIITLDSAAGRPSVLAQWDDGGKPRSAPIERLENHLAWPKEAESPILLAPALVRALHEVGRSATREPDTRRYAMTRVQVRGKDGELIGTDGKQALVWGGFKFPFAEDLLVPAVPLFGSKELAGEAAVSAGLAKEWLYLVIGPWQVWLGVDREGRFPDVRGAAPRSCPTRVTVDDRDAAEMLRALADLPSRDGEGRPVTVDLGDQVVVRSRDDGTGDTAEVRLVHSTAAGPPQRLVVDRDHLGRAVALGFRELRVSTPERPVAFRDVDRLFLCATLDPALVVPPAGDPNTAAPATTVVPSPPDPH